MKGSFTGATDNHAGKFVEANHGTLFLDEVGELPLDIQVKLLRALQEGEVDPRRRQASGEGRHAHQFRDEQGPRAIGGRCRFREDLFYRLNVFPIEAPPLRQRRDDVPALIDRFVARFNAEEGRVVRGATPETVAMLQGFDWPGNVRQLENAVFRAVILCEGEWLKPEDFPQISALRPRALAPANDVLPQAAAMPANDYMAPAPMLAPASRRHRFRCSMKPAICARWKRLSAISLSSRSITTRGI